MSPSSYTPPSFKGRFVSALLSRTSGIRRFLALAAATALLGSTAQAAPINLSTWISEGGGTWNLAPDNLSVTQTAHTSAGNAALFISPEASSLGISYSATIGSTGADDDYIGFVIGYQPGDLTGTALTGTPDYILIDWKQDTQGAAAVGLSISRVTGATTNTGLWDHAAEVTELARATNLGSTGWITGQLYNFRIDFTSSRIDVYVDGVLEISITGTFSDGRFGFYNYSQDPVVYSNVTRAAIVPQPIPVNQTTWMLIFGIGLFALYGIRRRSKKA